MTNSMVSVCLVTWNSASHLSLTLEALDRQIYQPLEIMVVDNASTDDSLARVQDCIPAARIILNNENRGFCGGHNQAIRASQGLYYLPLNPDVVMQPGYIAELVEALEKHPKCGSAAGKLLQKPGIIDTTGLFINRRRQQYLRGHGEADHGQYDTPDEVFGVDGAAPLYRREMLEDIKIDEQYFDESFFAHKEDVDLAWRARLFGWGCWYDPKAIAFHERSFKPGRREIVSPAIKVHGVKNRYLLLIKNELPSGWFRDGFQILWYDLKILVYMCLFERTSLKAINILWRNRANAWRWRQEIRRRKRVQPENILSWFK
jgi:GT2 family glycosyltransferase